MLKGFEFFIIENAIKNLLGKSNQDSAILPATIIENYYGQMSRTKKQKISKLVMDYYFENNNSIGTDIDNHIWVKFAMAMDDYYHEKINVNGDNYTLFMLEDMIYSYDKYIENPDMDHYLTQDTFDEFKTLRERFAARYMFNWVRDTQTLNIENYKNKDLFALCQFEENIITEYIYFDWIKPGNYTRWDLALDVIWNREMPDKEVNPKIIKRQYLSYIDKNYTFKREHADVSR